jgi:hypothetical protein
MAFGILCKHCSWQETEHEDKTLVYESDRKKIFPGRTRSLAECKKFVGERRLTEVERQTLAEDRQREEASND